jgi:hypothetical protein
LNDPPSVTYDLSVELSSGRVNCRVNRANHWVRVERSGERNIPTDVRSDRTIEHVLNDPPRTTSEPSVKLATEPLSKEPAVGQVVERTGQRNKGTIRHVSNDPPSAMSELSDKLSR